jgi:hypothetical protein
LSQEPTAPVSTPTAFREITYSIVVQKYRDEKPYDQPFEPAGDIIYEADYRLRLKVTARPAGYLYVLNEGPTQDPNAPEFLIAFPSETSNRGSAFLGENQQLLIPEKTWLRFDQDRGTEKLWLIWSQNSLPLIDEASRFANDKSDGVISDSRLNTQIKQLIDAHAEPKPTVEKSENRKQTTIKSSRDVAVYLLQLEHH